MDENLEFDALVGKNLAPSICHLKLECWSNFNLQMKKYFYL